MTEERRLLTGIWSGLLDAGSLRLRVKLVIAEKGATLFSLDQGGDPIPGNIGVLTEERVKIDFPSVQGNFEGRVVTRNRVEGMWRQRAQNLFLALEKGDVEFPAAPPPHPLTNERLAELRAEAGSPALAAASQRGASRTQLWVIGERAVGTAIAAKKSDRWHLGSITKSMTATLVGVLVDLGSVNWDDTIGEILGAEAPDVADAYTSVTFRHLLCHRSGLPKDIPGQQIKQFSREIADAREERKSWARIALSMPPKGAKGGTFEYSNNGYIVIGAMLEAKLGLPWENLIRTHLFEPLKLASAGFGAPGRKGATSQPTGHSVKFSGELRWPHSVGFDTSDNPVALGPAGRVHMSLRDLIRLPKGAS
jgi:CubicO group peptidase (beta-lactamase class C family)